MKVLEDLYFLNNWIDLVDAWTDGMSECETHSVTLNDLKSFYMIGKLGFNIISSCKVSKLITSSCKVSHDITTSCKVSELITTGS